ncbi:MAG: hypothetical protein AABY22_20625 [Nanoarchaeota archaeon]
MTDKICECGKYEDCLIDKCTCKCHEKVKTGKEIQEELDKKILILQEEVKKLRNRNQLARALLDEGVI